jgi:hypothetical protein
MANRRHNDNCEHKFLAASPRPAGDRFQRPLQRRSRFQQQVSASVWQIARMEEDAICRGVGRLACQRSQP